MNRTTRIHRGRVPLAAAAVAVLAGLAVATASPAAACGGLVGQNGTIQLSRTTTLAAYHDGVERYVTSFEFTGEGDEVGSIVPLPDAPLDVVRGGDWTLQRLVREVRPPRRVNQDAVLASAPSESGAEVLMERQIDALDITVVKGGGREVGEWAVKNGFFLTPDAPEVLDFYSRRSPIFMAAKFDAKRAKALNQSKGQGTPIMLTIPTAEPWVPLRILGLGLADKTVEADVFLLTDGEPKLLAGGSGLGLGKSEKASDGLLADLRSDKGMDWVPPSMWLSHLTVDAPGRDLGYDLAVATRPDALPSVERAGISASEARVISAPSPLRRLWPVGAGLATGLVAVAVLLVMNRRRDGEPVGGAPA